MYGLGYMLDAERSGMARFIPRPGGNQPPGQAAVIDLGRGSVGTDDLRRALDEQGEPLARVDAELEQLGL